MLKGVFPGQPIRNPAQVAFGMVLVLIGLALFLEGLELALFPLGRLMAEQLTLPSFVLGEGVDVITAFDWTDYVWVYVFAAAIGCLRTPRSSRETSPC